MSSTVEQIKARLDIVDVVQSYIKLQKAGANFRAHCPFHNEKSPSFYVSPTREAWHCFGCSKGGDLISFVMEIEGVEFMEALQILAVRAGVEIKQEDPRLVSERMRLIKLMEAATTFYEKQLPTEARALEYAVGRGLKSETIKEFRIGYAPDAWEAVVPHLQNSGFTNMEIEKSGMAIKSERDGKLYDRFRARIMFPINDATGRVVGFSGRIVPFAVHTVKSDSDPAKYINSPQTLLYDKSRVLYGFDKAKLAIRQANACILVEGQMDVVMSHQAGVKNAVAVSGTALTDFHLSSIKRLAEKVITAFDMDPAGGAATKRGVDMALREGLEVQVAVIHGGKDPADLVRENPELWVKSAAESVHILDFYLEMLGIKYKDDARELRKKAGEIVLPYIAMMASEMEKAHWVREVARRVGIKEEPIWEEVKKLGRLRLVPNYSALPQQPQPSLVKEYVAVISRKQLLEESILGIAAWKGAELAGSFAGRKEEVLSDEMRPLIAATASGNIPEDKKDFINSLAFKSELLYDESSADIKQELDILYANLEKIHHRLLLTGAMDQIQQAEVAGDHEKLKELTTHFKELSRKIL
jgi:DNA primase